MEKEKKQSFMDVKKLGYNVQTNLFAIVKNVLTLVQFHQPFGA